MPRYADNAKEQVRDAVDMVDLVGTRTELKRQGGAQYMGRCPFHEERTASLSVDADRKLYHCFGCGAGGDPFSFVQELEGLRFVEALEWLAQRYGVELEVADEDPRAAERRRREARLHELLERAAAFYARHLWESDEAAAAREHLRSRGLDEGLLREFRVGWAPRAGTVLATAAQKLGFGRQDLTATGLMRRDGRDFFQGRITFPLCDLRGRVLGFGARTLDPEEKAKYVNTPDGDLFHKRSVVFAADIARRPAAQAGSVVLAEGYTDVIALHQSGVRNAVATMGTALAEQQVGVLARMAPVLALALDADRAGQEAMLKAHEAAAGKLEVRVVPLPAGQDPADLLLASGPDALRALVADSVPFVRFRVLLELDRGDLRTGEGKDRVLAVVAPLLDQVGPVEREELIRTVAHRLQVDERVVRSQVPGAANGRAPQPERRGGAAGGSPASGRRSLDPAGRAEKAFLMACLALPSEGETALAQVPDDAFTSDAVRRAATHLRADLRDPAAALPEDDPQLRSLIAGLVVGAGRLTGVTPAAVRGQLANLRLAHLERRIAAARASGAGGIAAMVAERNAIRAEIDAGITATLDATRAPEG